jgi:predicted RNase H-like HicB family nuclease
MKGHSLPDRVINGVTVQIKYLDGLYFATSRDIKGLFVAIETEAEIASEVRWAIAEWREAQARLEQWRKKMSAAS